MRKLDEELKNKRRSIERVGIEQVLDDMEHGRRRREEIKESFITKNADGK